MSSPVHDDELSKLSTPQLIERITALTAEYSEAVERILCEILIRAMQDAE